MSNAVKDFEREWTVISGGALFDGAAAAATGLDRAAIEALGTAVSISSVSRSWSVPDVESTWVSLASRLANAPEGGNGAAKVHRISALPRRRLALSSLAAAAAVLVLVAAVSLRSLPGSVFYPVRRGLESTAVFLAPTDTSLHVAIAKARVHDLSVSLSSGSGDSLALANSLVTERSAVVRTGNASGVAAIDRQITAELPPALAKAPAPAATAVRVILGSLVPPGPVAPPSPSSAPAPGGSNGGGGGTGSGGGGHHGGSGGGSGHGNGGGGSGSGGDGSGGGSPGSGSGSGSGTSAGDGGGSGSGTSSGDGSSDGSSSGSDSSGSGSSGDGSGDSGGSGSSPDAPAPGD